MTLILLGGLGALALTAAAAATAALALSGHQQSAQLAFEAAEAGVAHALELAARTRDEAAIGETPYPEEPGAPATFEASIVRADQAGALPTGFSIGEHAAAFAARHFVIISDGRASRRARTRIEQGFYLVVPGTGP